ncbi:MAG: S-layer homology domain-containing protein [Zhaonellaceae bacterium]
MVTVKALAVKDGMMESDIATFTYTIAKPSVSNKVAAPTATIAGGIVQDETEITLNSDTDGAVIYYTLDGTEPNEKSFSGSYAAIRGTPGEIVTLKAFAAKDGMIASDIATFTYTIEAPQDEVSEYSPYLLKLRPPLNVNVSVVYNSQNKTVDIKASAYCSQCGGILDRTNTTTAVYQIVDEGGNPLELDISGDLGWNQENEQWEALNVNLSQVISQAAAVVVTFEDNNQHRATAQGEIYAGNAKLGLSTYNVIPGGNVFVYAAFTDLEGENAPRKGDLSVRFEGGRDKFVLSDNGEFGDLVPEDGIYSSEFSILGKGSVEIELYLGNTLVDSKIINVIDKPELAVITDFDALYAEFKDTGMQDGEDIDGNGTGDYYDLLECLAQYAEAHKGVVFNLDQEISKNNGYKYDYDALTHAARYTKAREIDTFIKNISPGESIKNIAIIGDDEVVPFARRLDPTYNIDGDNKYWEQEYYDDMDGGGANPTILDSQKGYIMTDVPYGSYSDHNPDYSTRPHLDAGVGRVFADRPLQLKNIILGYQEPIHLTNAAVFQMEEDTVDWLNSANNTLQPVLNANFKIGFVNDSSNPGFEAGKYYSYDRVNYPAGWTPADVTTALQNVCLNMLWTHCDHLKALTRKDGPLKADHLRSMIESPGHVLISTGCHSGYSISHDSPKGNYYYYNNSLVKSIIEKQISYIAPTVYGIGFKDYVGYHDLMMQRFLENLLDTSTSTVGEAQVKAYREYWQRIQPNFAGYFNVYAAYGTCYYGLPTQPIDHIGSGFRTTAANSKLATFTAEASSVPSKIVLEPEFKVSELADGKTLFEAQAEGSFNLQAFAPVMPLITRKIKLPADTIIREIDLAAFSASEYQEEVILPTAIPVHKSRGALEGSYELPGTYPETIYWWDTYDDGTGLELVLSVIPMQYNKDSKKVTLYDRLEFEIITEANEVWAWGSNYHGQIGDGTKDDKTVPTKIGSDGWTAVAAGGSRTLAIKGDGSLWLWGDDGSGMEKTIPSQIGKDKDWATVTAGPFHIFALKKNGSLWIWNSSQLDDGTPRVPTQIGEDYDWILAAAGESHFAALKEDGSLWTWGSNYDGQLGDGTKENKVVPTMLDGDKDWVAVATGSNHTLAIKSDGSLWSWGNNFNGQLGTGDKEYSSSPRRVGTENNWAKVFANDMRSFALKTDGSLWAWGGNVGTDPILTPTQIGTEDGWKTVAPGDRHVVALKLDGSLWVWGENYAGQLGDGTTEDKLIPTLISNDLAWIGIAAGSDHSVAIKDRSTVLSDDVATVAIDKAALTWNVIKGANATQNSVTTNLNLITSGANGTTISWSINPDEGLINTATGAVTRPSNSQGDKTVTLTAIISKGEFSQTKQFVLTITALSKGNPEDPGDNGSEPRGDGPGSSKKDRVNENKAVAYDENSLNEAFEKATPDADGKKMISIELTQVPNTQLFRNEFPASVFTSENGDRLIKLTSDVGTIVLPCNMLAGTELESKDNITISISKAEKANLSQEMQNIIGDRPIIDLNISQGNQKLTWYNPSSPVTVSVPYTPTPEELANPEHIVVWYINEEGNAVAVPNGRYNTDTGMVTFTTTHFSQFAIAYVHKTFKDLDRVPWAKKAIEVMASKGIISGTGENIYSPTANITRADYLVLLVKTMGLSADFDNNFDDVEASAYYYQAIGIAKKLGIAAGDENNRFNPRENISRQDMMVLTAKALEKKGLVDSEVSASLLNRFNDQRDIAQYAVQSAATLLKEGLIAGDGGKLRPRTQTTRAEAAAFLYNIYNRYE